MLLFARACTIEQGANNSNLNSQIAGSSLPSTMKQQNRWRCYLMDPTTTMCCAVRPLPTEMAYAVRQQVSNHGYLFAPDWCRFARDGQPATEKGPNGAGLYQTHGRILVQSWQSGTAFTPRNLGILPQICQLTPRLGEHFPGPVGSVANPPLPGKLDTKTSSSEGPRLLLFHR